MQHCAVVLGLGAALADAVASTLLCSPFSLTGAWVGFFAAHTAQQLVWKLALFCERLSEKG